MYGHRACHIVNVYRIETNTVLFVVGFAYIVVIQRRKRKMEYQVFLLYILSPAFAYPTRHRVFIVLKLHFRRTKKANEKFVSLFIIKSITALYYRLRLVTYPKGVC